MSISVICVYNNEAQLNVQLKTSLEKQDVEYEFVAINNENGGFQSAAAALNYGATKATGDILIFAHQDIYFKTSKELGELADAITQCETGTIIGAIGVTEPRKVYYGNYTEGEAYDPKLSAGFNKDLYSVSTVDECIFGMKRETWIGHPLDEQLCDNWHLYGVEACLWARKHGFQVYVYPCQIHHFSGGKISLGYMRNLRELCRVYRKDFKYIWTTCYKVRTNSVCINCLVLLWTINRFIKGSLS
ncbi:MAG: glycosyltransferase [Oscillospiraceae bacterium]